MIESNINSVDSRDNWSEHWSRYDQLLVENPATSMRHTLILNYIKGVKNIPAFLLDVGSGQGEFIAKALKNKVAKNLIGFELSEVGVAFSRKKVPQATFVQVNMLTPPEEAANYESSIDIAVCSEVVEHVDNPVEFLSNLKRYIKPGGQLILTVPGGPMSAFDIHLGHRTHYTRKSMESLLKSSGFKVDKIKMVGFPFFNLYRLLVVLRGNKVISDGDSVGSKSGKGFMMNMVLRTFSVLFRFNINDFPLGWQVVAIATRD